MSDKPDLDKAREVAKTIPTALYSCALTTEQLITIIGKLILEQRAEEAEFCARKGGPVAFLERAADLRRQAGGRE